MDGLTIIRYQIIINSIMATRYRGSPDDALALAAYVHLMRAAQAINTRLYPALQADHGLTQSQLGVLEALWHLGPMVQADLAARILVSASNLTTVIDNLERTGLVRRERDTADRRCSRVHLTDAGTARIAEVFPAHVRRLVAAMRGLSADQLRQFSDLTRALGLAAAAPDSTPTLDALP
jgi:MarR family transcriptional regulator, 2-MHQ and catechol-resistance regulon repressor